MIFWKVALKGYIFSVDLVFAPVSGFSVPQTAKYAFLQGNKEEIGQSLCVGQKGCIL